jgi:hypothetical protein
MTINANDKTASFISGETDKTELKVLEAKRKIAFVSGAHLNLRDVVEVDVSGTWWRVFTKDGKFHLVDPAKVNYATIA